MKNALIAFLIASCVGAFITIAAAEEVTMEDTLWQLTRYLDETGNWATADSRTTVDIRFSAGQMSGGAGCNRYFGGYELAGNEIRFTSPLGATRRACAPPIDEQERQYLLRLGDVAAWQVEEGTLVLTDTDGSALLEFAVFVALSLEDLDWHAQGINNGRGGVVSSASTHLSTARFSGGTVSGSGGCNRFHASYEIEADQIRIGPAAATRKLCAEPEGIMDQEQQFLAALERAHTFNIDPEGLELRDQEGALLIRLQAAAD